LSALSRSASTWGNLTPLLALVPAPNARPATFPAA
jgi:hypothetical protein